ncbi:MAG: phosphatase [Myxococcota bacterium]
MRFDLHLHSTRSDGKFEPDEVIRRCALGGLELVALTDHDLPSGPPPGLHSFEGREVYLLAGAELSGMWNGRELHLLVYFPDRVPESFASFCADQCRARASRFDRAISRLGLVGLAPAEAEAVRGEVSLTRHHLARRMVERGHVGHVRDAFTKYLSDFHGIVPPIDLGFLEAIAVARAAGGLTAWAHPTVAQVDANLPTFVAAGLEGIEVVRPGVSGEDRRKLRSAAKRHGLYVTGGSDWHGWGDESDLGLFRVEAAEIGGFLDRLRAC